MISFLNWALIENETLNAPIIFLKTKIHLAADDNKKKIVSFFIKIAPLCPNRHYVYQIKEHTFKSFTHLVCSSVGLRI